MRCSKCGREIDDRATFCGFCGQAAPTARPDGRQSGQQGFAGSGPYAPRYGTNPPRQAAPEKRGGKGPVVLIIVLAAISALILLFGAVFLLARSGKIDPDGIPLIGAMLERSDRGSGTPYEKKEERKREEEEEEPELTVKPPREEEPRPAVAAPATEAPAPTELPVPAATQRPTPAPTPSPTPTPPPTPTPTPEPTPEPEHYILPFSSTRLITEEDLKSLTWEECTLARNEIFARHGRMFKNAAIREYFEKQSWYKGTVPAEEFDAHFNDNLTAIEIANIQTIRNYETKTYGGSRY